MVLCLISLSSCLLNNGHRCSCNIKVYCLLSFCSIICNSYNILTFHQICCSKHCSELRLFTVLHIACNIAVLSGILCIQRDSKVCFSAILDAEVVPKKVTARFTSVIAFGKASLVEDEDERYMALKAFVDRLCAPTGLAEGMAFLERTIARTAIIRIDVEELKGKTSGAIEMDA